MQMLKVVLYQFSINISKIHNYRKNQSYTTDGLTAFAIRGWLSFRIHKINLWFLNCKYSQMQAHAGTLYDRNGDCIFSFSIQIWGLLLHKHLTLRN